MIPEKVADRIVHEINLPTLFSKTKRGRTVARWTFRCPCAVAVDVENRHHRTTLGRSLRL